ncbi:MAG TPA: DUF4214 domain-containing protein [Acidimicrobiales bacterium]|nr:DUF4214 domain-containing protein [Acidimicrobiales bacterium]
MKATTLVKSAVAIGTVLGTLIVVGQATVAGATTNTTVPCSGTGGGAAGLVAAITAANSGGGGTITLASGCTYSLTASNNGSNGSGPGSMATGENGLPVVTSTITITGSSTTIAANSSTFRVFEVDGPNGNLTLQGLTVTGGSSPFGGGLLNVEGAVTVDQTEFTGNTAQMGGGGIASGVVNPNDLGPIGTLTLNNSKVDGNTATSSGGGGILNHAGTATLNNSEVDNNNSAGGGGGIASGTGNGGAAGSSTLVLNGTNVNGNTETGGPMAGAGGIANGGMATITGSTINGNNAPGSYGGGILNHGQMTISSTTVNGNTAATDSMGNLGYGGGIANLNFSPFTMAPSSGVLTISQSQIEDNSATGLGGGILDGGLNSSGVPAVPAGALSISSSSVIANLSGSQGGLYANVGSVVSITGNSTVGNNTTSDCTPSSGNAAFLCAAYEDLLGRAPDPTGSSTFSSALSSGTSRAQVAYDIATSTEYRNGFVNGLYEAYLGRAVDPTGQSTWVGQLAHGASDASVLIAILASPEFYSDAGGTASGFVTALYYSLLGRAPDSGGLSSWVSQLNSGTSRATVATGFVISNEFLSSLIANQYLVLLDRPADSGGLSTWVSALSSGTPFEAVLAGIIGSNEFYTKATTFNTGQT